MKWWKDRGKKLTYKKDGKRHTWRKVLTRSIIVLCFAMVASWIVLTIKPEWRGFIQKHIPTKLPKAVADRIPLGKRVPKPVENPMPPPDMPSIKETPPPQQQRIVAKRLERPRIIIPGRNQETPITPRDEQGLLGIPPSAERPSNTTFPPPTIPPPSSAVPPSEERTPAVSAPRGKRTPIVISPSGGKTLPGSTPGAEPTSTPSPAAPLPGGEKTPPALPPRGEEPPVVIPPSVERPPQVIPPSAERPLSSAPPPTASIPSSPSMTPKRADKESDGYLEIGVLYAKKGGYEKAEELFQKVLREDPSSSSKAHNNLGFVYLKQGKHDLAEKEFMEALRIEPTFVLPYYNLACLYSRKGMEVEALIYLKKALVKDERVRQWALVDEDFEALKSDVVFQEIIGSSPPGRQDGPGATR